MSSRDLILGRVRRALADVPRDATPYEQAVERGYLREHGALGIEETVELLAENLADYRAIVHRTDADGLAGVVAGLLREHGSKSVLAPPGLREEWLSATDATRVPDRRESTADELDRVDSVVTACALAIAETGTIVLDGSPDQGRRRITLVPDHHICVVRVPEQVVSSVPQALERLDPARPLTWISGPSATSDIELDRVEGVHGPRTLEVVLVTGSGGD
ncbi:LutC/YkgG family protein [Streptomyces europaeiscabiei]|uniref:Lactate utilization protein C n=1 Tax=Streptomyces europaeiscabiei TaxID=146819 RepID=A0ABU4NKD9_9ACTN|nr:lactate utilization protein C [Streptomyces europaeiscabiei]MDX2527533.1 lactate utilization protein C [Streptomyces europaeiscabiei]MDX2758934.1 lactate utilization protein C [Streptomyces europaeiscabiei]MDX2769190.1 lactate utilization protein C [Streptomyces europaeiscabiei]MDX3545880.1 lactate utilization protein C [Streptomyces europaeiscabiei]MDX3555569.1 lactate utilization protein C [Streptomyces europaeiscabiei]